jgi:hypothetical protein
MVGIARVAQVGAFPPSPFARTFEASPFGAGFDREDRRPVNPKEVP